MLALAWLGPVITAVQHIVLPSMRATASASFLFINNLIGIAFGIYFLGWLSDCDEGRPRSGTSLTILDPLRPWHSICSPLLFYLFAAARLRQDLKS